MDKMISVKLSQAWIDRLDILANKGKISRHQLVVNMLTEGGGQLRLLKRIGIFQIGLAIRDIKIPGITPSKPSEEIEKPIPIKIDEKLLEEIETLAEQAGLSRHQMMRNIIHVSTEELEMLMKSGIGPAVLIYESLKDSLKGIISDGEKAMRAVLK